VKKTAVVLLSFTLLMISSAVAAVHADVKVYNTRVIRDYTFNPGVSTPYGTFDIEQYITMKMTVWNTNDGGSRSLNSFVANVWFLESGQVVGQGTSHSVVNMIDPVTGTVVNQMDILVTFRGSGQVGNYHLTMIYVEGELKVFHEVGTP
jgi:hypothetical protein